MEHAAALRNFGGFWGFWRRKCIFVSVFDGDEANNDHRRLYYRRPAAAESPRSVPGASGKQGKHPRGVAGSIEPRTVPKAAF